jgi:hypothetical protein
VNIRVHRKHGGGLTLRTRATVAFILVALSGAAAAQQTISVKNGGSLTYDVSSVPRPCGTTRMLPIPEYESDTYTNFVYTSSLGDVTELTGSVTFLQGTATSFGPCASMAPPTVELDGGGYLIDFTPGSTNTVGTAVLETPVGYLNPKYVILGVAYAPPGPTSFVQYSTTAFLSTTASIMDTSSTKNTWSTSVSASFKAIPFITSGKVTTMQAGSYTQTTTASSSVTLSAQSVNQDQMKGTATPYSPVNHDYDYVWLWLNPVLLLTVSPSSNTVTWNGYAVDRADQRVTAMDIWPVQVGFLNGDFGPLDPGDAEVLSRSWAVGAQTWPTGDGPGLTQADFAQILLADPFANSSYAVNVPAGSDTTSDGRFTLSGGSTGIATTFDYKQADPGEVALNQTLANTYTTTSTQGLSSTTTHTQTFGIDVSLSASVFIASLSVDLKSSQMLTWTHVANNSSTNTSTMADMLSITGPPCASTTFPCVPIYSGIPSEFDVYQDNIFGTFMFNGVN